MVQVRSFIETRIHCTGTGIESACLDVALPLPAEDHRGILSSFANDTSITWTGDTSIGLNDDDDPEDIYYMNCVATAGGTLVRTSTQTDEPRTIIWRVLRKSTILELDPVDLNTRSKAQFRKIRIQTPAAFLDNCITICENPETGYLVLDFITTTSHLYTISFSFSEFIANAQNSMSDQGHSLTEKNASRWRSIKYPFMFDLKKPHLLYAVSHRELVAATVDGALVQMKRSTALSDITSTTFSDPSNQQGLSRLFGWGQSDNIPGRRGLSSRTTISMVAVSQARLLVTLSINRQLRVWSLESLTLLDFIELSSLQDSIHQEKITIGPEPMKLLSLPAWDSKYEAAGFIPLSTFIPIGDGTLKVWKLNFGSGNVIDDLGDTYEIIPQPPDSYSTWLVNDFNILDNSAKSLQFQFSIMWKSNTSSAIYQTSAPFIAGQDSTWFIGCETDTTDLEYLNNDYQNNDKATYFLNKIFGPAGYSKETIMAALPIYGNHYALKQVKSAKLDTSEQSLIDRVCQTVGTAVTLGHKSYGALDYAGYKSDLAQEWNRFDRLCSELERQGNEALSLSWDPNVELFWVVKASVFSVIRPTLPVEIAYNNKSSAPSTRVSAIVAGALNTKPADAVSILKVLDTMHAFRINLAYVHYGQIMAQVMDDVTSNPKFSTAERMTSIYTNYLETQVSETAFDDLNRSLLRIDDVDGTLSALYSVISSYVASAEQSGASLTVTGVVVASKALFEVLTTSLIVVSDALLLILATVSDGKLNINSAQLYSKYLTLFKAISALLAFLEVRPLPLPAGDNSQITDLKNLSLNTSASYSSLPLMQSLVMADQGSRFDAVLSRKGFAQIINQLWSHWDISSSSAASRLIAQLLIRGDYEGAHEISKFLPFDSFSSFIRAHICLQSRDSRKARFLFRAASIELAERHLTSEELEIVKGFGLGVYSKHSFGNGLARYFLCASKASLGCGLNVCALQLCRDAQTNLGFVSGKDEKEKPEVLDEKTLELTQLVCEHLFETGITVRSYDDAYNAVIELALLFDNEHTEPIDEAEDGDENEGNFPPVEEDKVTPYVESLASYMVQTGNIARLCQYPFVGLTNVITDLFLKKAQAALVRATRISLNVPGIEESGEDAFLYYQALYAWNVEHHDFRGGKSTRILMFLKIN